MITIPYWLFYLATASGAFLGTMAAFGVVTLWRRGRWHKEQAKTFTSDEVEASLAPGGGQQSQPTPADPKPLIRPTTTILAGPPMVGQYTLRDWLVHYHRLADEDGLPRDIWQLVVSDFYGKAASDAEVFAVFQRAARERGIDVGALVEEVQRHFLRQLLILTHVGLTVGLAEKLRAAHAHLRLDTETYWVVAQALVQTLQEFSVPPEARDQVVKLAQEMEPYLVAA